MTKKTEEVSEWFYELNGKRIGGVTENEIVSLINKGLLSYGSAVWKKDFQDWKKIEKTDFITHLNQNSPPPLATEHISNSVVWTLAFAPVLGLILEYIVAGVMYADNQSKAEFEISNGSFWYITLLLNISLSYWDEKRLKNAGINTSKFSGFVWLVPVYLFQRAKSLKQSKAYFIVWIVMFILVISDY